MLCIEALINWTGALGRLLAQFVKAFWGVCPKDPKPYVYPEPQTGTPNTTPEALLSMLSNARALDVSVNPLRNGLQRRFGIEQPGCKLRVQVLAPRVFTHCPNPPREQTSVDFLGH